MRNDSLETEYVKFNNSWGVGMIDFKDYCSVQKGFFL